MKIEGEEKRGKKGTKGRKAGSIYIKKMSRSKK